MSSTTSRTAGRTRRVETASAEGHSAVVLTVSGHLDVYTAWSFDIAAASWDPATGAIVADLRDVTLIDSSGLRALARLRNASVRAGLMLGVVGAPGLDRILDLAGLDAGVVRGPDATVVAETLEGRELMAARPTSPIPSAASRRRRRVEGAPTAGAGGRGRGSR